VQKYLIEGEKVRSIKWLLLVISISILTVGCNTTYTFINQSSYDVTIIPEYGEEFKVYKGMTKKLESKHSNMNMSFAPSNWVRQTDWRDKSTIQERKNTIVFVNK